jgi:DNA-binding beta-propeller fold protein YncE
VPVKVLAALVGDEFMGRLKHPRGLFYDEAKKRFYVADSGNKRLVSFDSEFNFLAELSYATIELPMWFVKNSEGRFFVVDGAKSVILYIDTNKKIIEPWRIKGLPRGDEVFIPGAIAIDASDSIYVVDKLNKRILVIDRDGNFLREIAPGGKGFNGFNDVKVDDRGDVYALDTIGGVIYIFRPNGKLLTSFGSRGSGPGQFRFPVSLAVNMKKHIYVVDAHAGNIKVFDRSGTVQRSIASKGNKDGELNSPSCIFIDKEGKIYTIDGDRVQVFEEEQ